MRCARCGSSRCARILWPFGFDGLGRYCQVGARVSVPNVLYAPVLDAILFLILHFRLRREAGMDTYLRGSILDQVIHLESIERASQAAGKHFVNGIVVLDFEGFGKAFGKMYR